MAENKLQKYRSKRNFLVTNEPKGTVGKKKPAKLKFSVQRHAARADHFDLRLELGGVAVSWAVPKGPSFCTADKRLAMRVEDHPLDYMEFEGVIPKGEYGGGTVMLWDEGEWTPRSDPEKGLAEGSLKFRLDGARLKGNWALVRMKNRGNDASEPWLFIKERDEFAKRSAGISKYARGVRSGKSMAEIAKSGAANPFRKADVMLARLCETLPEEKGWLYELKYDGYRVLAFCEGGKTRLTTRNGNDCTKNFPLAAEAVTRTLKGRAAVVDGEMVVTDREGIPDFGALQSYVKRKTTEGLGYVLFDLLALDGEDLRGRPLLERKQKLKALLKKAPPLLSYSEHAEKLTQAELEAIRSRGVEGIVAKRADAPYEAGKNGSWLKLKFRNLREFVVGGYTRSGEGVRSLLVGYYEGKELKYAGRVGTGFDDATRKELCASLEDLVCERAAFSPAPRTKTAVWVRPVLAVQVEYAELTAAGLLRQASFKGLRADKAPREITDERSEPSRKAKAETVCGVGITHPEKIMFPAEGWTKRELAEYYSAVAPRMLPYVKDRLLSVVCCPSGIGGERFFRRHLDGKFPGIGRAPASDGEEYFYAVNAKGLISLVQYNAVEIHIWGSRRTAADRPDLMVFDLDPDESMALSEVRRGARDLKDVLDELGLHSFLKTSGGKGYHIAVPFRAGIEGQTFRDFAKGVAEIMAGAYPDRYLAVSSKKARSGKIYIDWQRNSPGSTSAAPYSARAREGAPVSMPIAWEELGKVAPGGVDLRTAVERLGKPDPWEDFFRVKAVQRLKRLRMPLGG